MRKHIAVSIGIMYRIEAVETMPIAETVTNIAAIVAIIAIVVCGLLSKS